MRIRLYGRTGREVEIEAILDTGFNDDLTLPPAVVRELELELIAPAEATLAGQIVVSADYYRTRLLWDGRQRVASVLELEGAPLLGMGLLEGHRVTLDVIAHGEVAIESI